MITVRVKVLHICYLVDPSGYYKSDCRSGKNYQNPCSYGRDNQQADPCEQTVLQELGREPTPEEVAKEMKCRKTEYVKS